MDVLLPLRHPERRHQQVLPLLRAGPDDDDSGPRRPRPAPRRHRDRLGAGAAAGRVRHPRGAGARGHGDRLQGPREAAGARRRHQGPAVFPRLRQRVRRALPARGPHPGIIPIYRVGKSGRVIYFVMKFLRGKPLSSVLAARGSLPPAEIRQVLVQVARALAYAHKSGIVHRDIKPDNIMFDEHGQAVVTDFGIAKAATGSKLTGTGMSIGTPHYMSPEQARAQQLDGRSDIYSLGVVAYQCLTGSVPFDGEDSFSIGYKHIMEEVPTPPLETYDQRTLFEVIRKMMAKVPDDRFQTSDDLVQALEAGGGFAAVGLSTAPTRAIPSLEGARIAGAPTTPLPRTPTGARLAAAVEPHHHRSVAAGIALWVLVVVVALGAPGLYAYKKGLLFFARAAVPESLAAIPRDTLAQRLLGDTGAGGAPADSAPTRATVPPAPDTSCRPIPPGTPGRLTLQGVSAGARITLNGQPLRGPRQTCRPAPTSWPCVQLGSRRSNGRS